MSLKIGQSGGQCAGIMAEEQRSSHVKNLGLAAIAGLTGFIALFIALGALLLGLWLDSQLGTRGPMTVCLLVLSVPLSLFIMVRVALWAVNRLPVPTLSSDEVLDETDGQPDEPET